MQCHHRLCLWCGRSLHWDCKWRFTKRLSHPKCSKLKATVLRSFAKTQREEVRFSHPQRKCLLGCRVWHWWPQRWWDQRKCTLCWSLHPQNSGNLPSLRNCHHSHRREHLCGCHMGRFESTNPHRFLCTGLLRQKRVRSEVDIQCIPHFLHFLHFRDSGCWRDTSCNLSDIANTFCLSRRILLRSHCIQFHCHSRCSFLNTGDICFRWGTSTWHMQCSFRVKSCCIVNRKSHMEHIHCCWVLPNHYLRIEGILRHSHDNQCNVNYHKEHIFHPQVLSNYHITYRLSYQNRIFCIWINTEHISHLWAQTHFHKEYTFQSLPHIRDNYHLNTSHKDPKPKNKDLQHIKYILNYLMSILNNEELCIQYICFHKHQNFMHMKYKCFGFVNIFHIWDPNNLCRGHRLMRKLQQHILCSLLEIENILNNFMLHKERKCSIWLQILQNNRCKFMGH